MPDIFISHTKSDRDWTLWIAKELRALGHTPHVDELEIKAGDDIYAWMEQRMDTADRVLCVISDEYLRKPFSALERNAAIWQTVTHRPGFVLFVVVKPCRLPTLIEQYSRCELYGVGVGEARERFRAFMEGVATVAPIAFPGEAFAVSNIPIRVPTHFLGRKDSIDAIEAAFARHKDRVAIAALHGLRGVGKSTLAAAYAETHRGDYRATWWIRAQTELTMRADLVGLGVRLKWVDADEKEDPALAVVMERLRNEGIGCLLIYDNAPDPAALRTYLPSGGAVRVLVTSSAHTWRSVAEPVEIRQWSKHIGAEYLIACTGRSAERSAAEALSEELGGLPLAHEQAATYCERLNVALADYAKRFADAPARLLDDTRDAPADYHDGLTVAKTFTVAIEEATKLHPAAEPLIVHAALLAPEPIPLFLFSEGRENFDEPLATALDGEGLEEAVAALRVFALVEAETIVDEREPETTTNCIRLHRLVRQVAASRRDSEMRDELQRSLINATATVYPDVWDVPQAWPRARRLDALALALVANDAIVKGAAKATAYLLNRTGTYRQSALGAYAQARPLLERALAIAEMVDPEGFNTAGCLNNLALLLVDQGDLAGARPLFERALAIYEKVRGPEHPDTAIGVGGVASILLAQGDIARARPLCERALAIYEKKFGPDHPRTAVWVQNLAVVLEEQGELARAQLLYERALAVCEKISGPDHPNTALTLDNLARLLKDRGDFVGARPLLDRALAIEEKVHGPEHPATARVLNSLATLLKDQGDFVGARPLLDRALQIEEKVLGPDHPNTASTLDNLAGLLKDRGDFAAARPLFERALAIEEKVLGPEHPTTAATLNGLAMLLKDQGDFVGARPLLDRALAIEEKVRGPEHPKTNRVRRSLATLLLSTDCPADALALGEAALAAHHNMLGRQHKWTKDSARVTADALAALGRGEEASALRAKYEVSE